MSRLSSDDIDLIRKMVDDGCISRQKHPSLDLWILNYTKKANFNKVWNRATRMCRGLIIDGEWNVVARPFEKFFNYEEICGSEELRRVEPEKFEVYEKLDGSLGILYWTPDGPAIATRGSFISDQAVHASKLVQTKYREAMDHLDKSKTYLFEIIYPGDIKVVNYGDLDDIVLLAVIDIETGAEQDIYEHSKWLKCAARYDGVDWKTIRKLTDSYNREGFVVRFESGFRMKLKFEEYLKLAATKMSITPKKVIEHYIDGTDKQLDSLVENLDWETQRRYEEIVRDVQTDKIKMFMRCKRIYEQHKHLDGKDYAASIKNYENKQVLFAMKNGKPRELIDQLIYKILLKRESQL